MQLIHRPVNCFTLSTLTDRIKLSQKLYCLKYIRNSIQQHSSIVGRADLPLDSTKYEHWFSFIQLKLVWKRTDTIKCTQFARIHVNCFRHFACSQYRYFSCQRTQAPYTPKLTIIQDPQHDIFSKHGMPAIFSTARLFIITFLRFLPPHTVAHFPAYAFQISPYADALAVQQVHTPNPVVRNMDCMDMETHTLWNVPCTSMGLGHQAIWHRTITDKWVAIGSRSSWRSPRNFVSSCCRKI